MFKDLQQSNDKIYIKSIEIFLQPFIYKKKTLNKINRFYFELFKKIKKKINNFFTYMLMD